MDQRLQTIMQHELDCLEQTSKDMLAWCAKPKELTWEDIFNASSSIRNCSDTIRAIMRVVRYQ